jgi:4'-phosphopantetheinyl transferase
MDAAAMRLAPGTVDVWWCDLGGRSEDDHAAWAGVASADERARADRFSFAADRRRFLARRGLLRTLLAGYLRKRPEDLRFACDEKGKPRLPGEDVRFNLSRAGDGVLIGFTRGPDIGVDVERVKDGYTGEEIAGKFFAPSETAALTALPESSRSEAFFRVWTAKEAYLKARGDGLAYPLDAFAVTVDSGEPARLRWHRDGAEAGRWWLLPLTPSAGFVATVAVEGGIPELALREVAES